MIDEGKVIFSLRDGSVSPTFIASADIHLGHKLYNIPDLEDDLRDNFVRLCDLAISKKVQYLIIVGDLFDDNVPKPSTISLVSQQVSRLAEHGVTPIGIAGDHDKPIQGDSWCSVSGICPITIDNSFAGFDYYDYSSGIQHVMEKLVDGRKPEKIQWIFLHCQFPQLFQFAEDKKKIDFGQVEVFDTFPNLQGIIAGDIHDASEGELTEKGKTAYIGYTGSLGVCDISEAARDHSVIYCDGTTLRRIPFVQRRSFIKINFRGDAYKNVHMDMLVNQYKDAQFRPLFHITYDSDSEKFLNKIKPLYSAGFVRTSQTIKSMKTGVEEVVVNVRSEMKTEEKIETALKACCEGDQEVYDLLSNTLTSEDPKVALDAFRERALA
jgi:hypothetical protein